jgi:hypothetical protein
MRHRAWAAWLVAGALFMSIVMPAGFMPVASGGSVILEPCSGHGPETMAMPGMAHHPDRQDRSGKDRMPCGFSGNAAPSLTLADAILPLAATLFVAAPMFRTWIGAAIVRPAFLRPPLRGPPAAF